MLKTTEVLLDCLSVLNHLEDEGRYFDDRAKDMGLTGKVIKQISILEDIPYPSEAMTRFIEREGAARSESRTLAFDCERKGRA